MTRSDPTPSPDTLYDSGDSCNACLRFAQNRGLKLGDSIRLRGAHLGTVEAIRHDPGGVILVKVGDDVETVLIPLVSALKRRVSQ